MTIPASVYLALEPDSAFVRSAQFEAAEDAFYASLRTASGSWKTTHRRRLDRIEDLFFEVISRGAGSPSVLMDIGISSGITTLEWLAKFERRGMKPRVIGTDISLSVYIATLGRSFRALVESGGSILQLELFGRGIRLWCGWRDYLNGTFVIRKTLAALAQWRLTRLGVKFPIERTHFGNETNVSGPYRLVTPQLKGRADVVLSDDNILLDTPAEFVGAADVVRIANVLQHGYFSADQIAIAVRNLRARCRGEGSLIIVCRDRDGSLEGSILRVSATGYVVEARLGPGSEVEFYFTGDRPGRHTA